MVAPTVEQPGCGRRTSWPSGGPGLVYGSRLPRGFIVSSGQSRSVCGGYMSVEENRAAFERQVPAPQVNRTAQTPERWRKTPRGAESFFCVLRAWGRAILLEAEAESVVSSLMSIPLRGPWSRHVHRAPLYCRFFLNVLVRTAWEQRVEQYSCPFPAMKGRLHSRQSRNRGPASLNTWRALIRNASAVGMVPTGKAES